MSRDIKLLNALVPVLNLVPEHSDLTRFEIVEKEDADYAIPIYGEDIPEIGITHGEGAYIKLQSDNPIGLIREIINGI